jgi:hypothetical protein
MRGTLVFAAAILGAGLHAGDARAVGFLTHDLGAAGSYEDCIARAERTLNAYVARYRNTGSEVVTSDWTSSAFMVDPGDADVNIACPYRNFQVEVALITVHSRGDEAERETILDRLLQLWDDQGQSAPLRK